MARVICKGVFAAKAIVRSFGEGRGMKVPKSFRYDPKPVDLTLGKVKPR